ncbi:SRPBCC domain-containing protein [Corynebacterium sp. S7]
MEKVYEAIADPSKWWISAIKGKAEHEGEVFEVNEKDQFSQFRVVEAVPYEKLVWHVEETGHNSPVDEFNDTDLVFEFEVKGDATELTFTHRGLQEHMDNYTEGTNEWMQFIRESLVSLVTEGVGKPVAAV